MDEDELNDIENKEDIDTPESEEDNKRDKTPPKKEDKKPLDDQLAKQLKEIMKWKQKAKEAEDKAKSLSEKYSDFDIEAAKEALSKLEEQENKELERKGEYDRLVEKQRTIHEKAMQEAQAKLKELEEQNRQMLSGMDELYLTNAFANSRFITDKMALTPNKTKALYGAYFERKDGVLVGYDAPKGAATRTPLVDASGSPLSFDDAIAEIINNDPDKDFLLKSEQKHGANSRQNINTDIEKPKKYVDSMDKIAAGLANPKNLGQAFNKK